MMQIIKEFVVDQYINKGVILKQKRHDNFNGKCLSLGVTIINYFLSTSNKSLRQCLVQYNNKTMSRMEII